MAQIKSYLSLESVPSQQFQTPPTKKVLHTMTTNNSLSFSNTLASFDNKSAANRKFMNHSHQLYKNISNKTRDYVEQQDQIENQSAITLSPAVTHIDLNEIINVLKMVAFMTKQSQQRQLLIERKSKAVKQLQTKIYLLEERMGFQKKQFQKKERTLKSKSLSVNKAKKRASEVIEREILEMKLEIQEMRRKTISSKKFAVTARQMESGKKGERMSERSKRQKIYVPLPVPPYINDSLYPHIPLTQRQSRKSQYLAFHHQKNYAHPSQASKDHSVCYSYDKHSEHDYGTFGKRTISNNDMNILTSQKKSSENEMSGKKILDILQQKLQMDFNVQSREPRGRNIITLQPPNNPEAIQQSAQKSPMQILGLQSKDFRSNANFNPNSNGQSIHINVLKEVERQQPNLDYFHDDQINEEIRQSGKSKKSSKNVKHAKGLTNTWKKDKDDEEIVELLKKSISLSQLQKQKPSKKPPSQRSQLGAKLIVTNICAEQSSFDYALPQKSRSRQQIPLNPNNNNSSSQVDIFVDNSEQKSNNSSSHKQSKKKLSYKRQNIMNSSIGIVLNDMSDSMDDSPLKNQSKARTPVKNTVSIVKKISIISQALEDSQVNTPIPQDSKQRNNFNLEPSIESRYTETVRQTNLKDAIEMLASRQSIPQKKSSEELHTPPLSRPPSLLEQSNDLEEEYYEDDMIDSIKLSASSKIIDSPSKFNQKSEIKVSNQEGEQDILGDIRLVAMSRISREQSEKGGSSSKNLSHQQNSSIVDKMTFSEVSPSPASNNEQSMDLIDSQLRQSSRSVIVKKGSAIQKSAVRQQSNMKNSSKGINNVRSGSILTGKSGDISNAIEEQAQQQQDQFSSIVRKHKRNVTDLN